MLTGVAQGHNLLTALSTTLIPKFPQGTGKTANVWDTAYPVPPFNRLLEGSNVPSRSARVSVAVLVGCYGIAWLLWDHWRDPLSVTDFDPVWYAARALRLGLDPYIAIGPAATWHKMEWPLFYPLPAVVFAVPFSFLPLIAARCVMVGGSSALLAFGVTRHGWTPLILFISGAYVEAARLAQWSIVFTASLALPILAVLFPVKPTLGAIVAAGFPRPSRRVLLAVGAGWIVLLAVSWLAMPSWVGAWLGIVRQYPQYRPLALSPVGAVLLLAAFKWRRPEARLLLAYALIPHLRLAYEALPVLLVAKRRFEFEMLAVGSAIAYAIQTIVLYPQDHTLQDPRYSLVLVACVYLPALVMVLRRPNETE